MYYKYNREQYSNTHNQINYSHPSLNQTMFEVHLLGSNSLRWFVWSFNGKYMPNGFCEDRANPDRTVNRVETWVESQGLQPMRVHIDSLEIDVSKIFTKYRGQTSRHFYRWRWPLSREDTESFISWWICGIYICLGSYSVTSPRFHRGLLLDYMYIQSFQLLSSILWWLLRGIN